MDLISLAIIIIGVVSGVIGIISGFWYFWDKFQDYRKSRKLKTSGIAKSSNSPDWRNIEKTIIASDPRSDWNTITENSKTITSYKKDMNLRFEVKYEEDGIQSENFNEPWANSFPDPSATGYWCGLYYGATLIQRFILISVDGGRALLPLPKTRSGDTIFPNLVLPLDYKVAQIHDSLDTLQEYMSLAGLYVKE